MTAAVASVLLSSLLHAVAAPSSKPLSDAHTPEANATLLGAATEFLCRRNMQQVQSHKTICLAADEEPLQRMAATYQQSTAKNGQGARLVLTVYKPAISCRGKVGIS